MLPVVLIPSPRVKSPVKSPLFWIFLSMCSIYFKEEEVYTWIYRSENINIYKLAYIFDHHMRGLDVCDHNKVCLVDVDSSIPNLALMKVSSYYKKHQFNVDLIKLNYTCYEQNKREKVILDGSKYDKVYVSTIFTINKGLVEVDNCSNVYFGGTGHDGFEPDRNLPKEIEHVFPDYKLYPDNKYSIGYLTRGCIRNCAFCFIPKKEGFLKLHSQLKEFYNPELPKIMLLDNNFLASPKCIELLKELKATNKKVTFKQGLDFRLLTKEKAELLSTLNYDGEFIFAFDRYKDRQIIEKNLKEVWLPLVKPWHTKFFVLVGFDSSLKEDLERVHLLKKYKCLAYVMRHTDCYSSPNKPFYTDLASWCNQPPLFKNMTFKEFIKKRHVTKERYEKTIEVVRKNKLVLVLSNSQPAY